MEESLPSVEIHSRKRKKSRLPSSNSTALIGILTPSKLCFHRNRSGLSRPDPVRRKTISSRPEIESVEAFLNVNRNNASRVSCIKDLRMRRVFTPDLNSVLKEEEEDNENEERKKVLKGSDDGSDSGRVLDPDVDDVKEEELEKSEITVSRVEDERNDVENGLNLKDRAICGNGYISKSEMVLNRCGRRKVFKNSSSFSYRRLLPYLMDIVNDESSVSKIEIVDAGIPSKLQKLDGKNVEMRSTSENSYTSKLESIGTLSDDTNPSEDENVQKSHSKVPFNQQYTNGAENGLGQDSEIIRPLKVEQICHENDAGRIHASVGEECSQMTPPDPDIFTKREVIHGGESMEASNLLAENQNFNSLLVGSEKRNDYVSRKSPTSKHGINSINRSVLNPCSRLRLFRNPGSLSYRRLLPILIEMSNNNSCASRIAQHPMPQVDFKEDIHPVLAVTAEQNHVNKIETENSHEKQNNEGRNQNMITSMVPLLPSDGSSSDTEPQSSSVNYSSNVEPNSVNSEILHDPCMLIDLQREGMPQSQSTHGNLEAGFDCKENDSASTPSSTISDVILAKQSTSEEHVLVEKPKTCLDMGLELHNKNGESNEKVNLNECSSRIEVSDAFLSPTNGSFKGILKRNRRGCRGLCNCLNCASFRLHADRAFEFSRNQMHDAEEVASVLMNELANLRLLLEKSTITDNDLAAIQLNPVLIKQACDRALETEKLAKERLIQLNYDLNVHCRIPTLLQPKVTFANYIQERAVPVLDPSTSTEKKV